VRMNDMPQRDDETVDQWRERALGEATAADNVARPYIVLGTEHPTDGLCLPSTRRRPSGGGKLSRISSWPTRLWSGNAAFGRWSKHETFAGRGRVDVLLDHPIRSDAAFAQVSVASTYAVMVNRPMRP
jgi:hypothetical protein